ncbi:MAG: 3-phosphoshikimate 1-carboxyvinyltransferase [Treponema sp.]|nr:3-phosphoshikimate 1-carboxyvinyltransferase [Treponema sp.]
MNVTAKRAILQGKIRVPGSKSHTIRAVLLASLADGTSHISNPLPSADCLSAAHAVPLLGAAVDFGEADSSVWTVQGAGRDVHLPDDVVNVGDSGSLLYFMSPIAATFPGWSIFTGDESIRNRPVEHVADALRQLGCEAYISRPGKNAPPLLIRGPAANYNVVTDGQLSQYVSGMMMAATRMDGTLEIELTDPKETPYLTMTRLWLESLGVRVSVSPDFKHITVTGPALIQAFDRTIPSDWEAVAFPLIAALMTDSEITIENVDGSGSQGDDAIIQVLQSVGADISWDRMAGSLTVRGGRRAHAASDAVPGRLSAQKLPAGELHVNLAGFPDAICAVAAVACFIEGTTIIEDVGVCRKKETDRIKVMKEELEQLGINTEEGPDCLVIHGHSPLTVTGEKNSLFSLHGGVVESYGDHRVAMSLSCLGLGMPDGETLTVNGAECCSVSFPGFFDVMNRIGAGFTML